MREKSTTTEHTTVYTGEVLARHIGACAATDQPLQFPPELAGFRATISLPPEGNGAVNSRVAFTATHVESGEEIVASFNADKTLLKDTLTIVSSHPQQNAT